MICKVCGENKIEHAKGSGMCQSCRITWCKNQRIKRKWIIVKKNEEGGAKR